jgi:hypothetical protein
VPVWPLHLSIGNPSRCTANVTNKTEGEGAPGEFEPGHKPHERIKIGDPGIDGGDHALREVKDGVIPSLLQL